MSKSTSEKSTRRLNTKSILASISVLFFSIAIYYYYCLPNVKPKETLGATSAASASAPSSTAPSSTISTTMSGRATTGAIIALSHGGGPMPLLNDPSHASMIASMRNRVPDILNLTSQDPALKPRAIILVTAHWVASSPLAFPAITASQNPSLLFDYHGFPSESYNFKYPAPGAPDLAQKLAAVAKEHGLSPKLHQNRDWDHGVFVPLLLARPQADVPVLQVSVLGSDDARAHFRLGRALGDLQRREAEAGNGPIAIVGSGFASFHNLRFMFATDDSPEFQARHAAWNAAVSDAATTIDAKAREDKFADWRSWPDAFISHPARGSEHFMPLAVCAGAAGDEEAKSYADDFMRFTIHSYYWN